MKLTDYAENRDRRDRYYDPFLPNDESARWDSFLRYTMDELLTILEIVRKYSSKCKLFYRNYEDAIHEYCDSGIYFKSQSTKYLLNPFRVKDGLKRTLIGINKLELHTEIENEIDKKLHSLSAEPITELLEKINSIGVDSYCH